MIQREGDSRIFYSIVKELGLNERVKQILKRGNTIFMGDKLYYLNLSNLRIDFLPKILFQLKNLRHLDLSSNNLSHLDKEVQKLENLRYLNLQGNNLDSIPESISKNKMLQYLDIGRNKILELNNMKI